MLMASERPEGILLERQPVVYALRLKEERPVPFEKLYWRALPDDAATPRTTTVFAIKKPQPAPPPPASVLSTFEP
jgi:hypothetical protein